MPPQPTPLSTLRGPDFWDWALRRTNLAAGLAQAVRDGVDADEVRATWASLAGCRWLRSALLHVLGEAASEAMADRLLRRLEALFRAATIAAADWADEPVNPHDRADLAALLGEPWAPPDEAPATALWLGYFLGEEPAQWPAAHRSPAVQWLAVGTAVVTPLAAWPAAHPPAPVLVPHPEAWAVLVDEALEAELLAAWRRHGQRAACWGLALTTERRGRPCGGQSLSGAADLVMGPQRPDPHTAALVQVHEGQALLTCVGATDAKVRALVAQSPPPKRILVGPASDLSAATRTAAAERGCDVIEVAAYEELARLGSGEYAARREAVRRYLEEVREVARRAPDWLARLFGRRELDWLAPPLVDADGGALDGRELLGRLRRPGLTLLVAEVGWGKSAALAWLARELAAEAEGQLSRRDLEQVNLPVWIVLGPDTRPPDGAPVAWLEPLLGPVCDELIQRLRGPAEAGLVVLVDGLDEVPDRAARRRIRAALHQLGERFGVLVASRPGAIDEVPSGQAIAGLGPWEPTRRRALAQDLLGSDAGPFQDLLAADRALAALADHPLLLALLAGLFGSAAGLSLAALAHGLEGLRPNKAVERLDLLAGVLERLAAHELRADDPSSAVPAQLAAWREAALRAWLKQPGERLPAWLPAPLVDALAAGGLVERVNETDLVDRAARRAADPTASPVLQLAVEALAQQQPAQAVDLAAALLKAEDDAAGSVALTLAECLLPLVPQRLEGFAPVVDELARRLAPRWLGQLVRALARQRGFDVRLPAQLRRFLPDRRLEAVLPVLGYGHLDGPTLAQGLAPGRRPRANRPLGPPRLARRLLAAPRQPLAGLLTAWLERLLNEPRPWDSGSGVTLLARAVATMAGSLGEAAIATPGLLRALERVVAEERHGAALMALSRLRHVDPGGVERRLDPATVALLQDWAATAEWAATTDLGLLGRLGSGRLEARGALRESPFNEDSLTAVGSLRRRCQEIQHAADSAAVLAALGQPAPVGSTSADQAWCQPGATLAELLAAVDPPPPDVDEVLGALAHVLEVLPLEEPADPSRGSLLALELLAIRGPWREASEPAQEDLARAVAPLLRRTRLRPIVGAAVWAEAAADSFLVGLWHTVLHRHEAARRWPYRVVRALRAEQALAEAYRQRLTWVLLALPAGVGRHPLVRDELVADLTANRRPWVRRAAALLLERLAADGACGDPSALAARVSQVLQQCQQPGGDRSVAYRCARLLVALTPPGQAVAQPVTELLAAAYAAPTGYQGAAQGSWPCFLPARYAEADYVAMTADEPVPGEVLEQLQQRGLTLRPGAAGRLQAVPLIDA